MRVSATQIETAAKRFAAAHLGAVTEIADIPVAERATTIKNVADMLGCPPRDVLTALSVHWLETSARDGVRVAGGDMTSASSSQRAASLAQGGLSPTAALLQNRLSRQPPLTSNDLLQRATSGKPVMLPDEQPFGFLDVCKKRAADVDAMLPALKPGQYGQLDLKALPNDDPRLDLPVFRGMGSMDPAVHALELCGRLVPGGDSPDYEGFKRYDNREPLDAYEWTLDPFVALKGAGGRGVLAQTTLRELRDAGVDVFRKTTDSEGGFFVAGVVQPRVQQLSHGPGHYSLEAPEPTEPIANGDVVARRLAKAVPGAGGWDAFLEEDGKLQAALEKRGARGALVRVEHWMARLRQLDPGSTLPDRWMTHLKGARDGGVKQLREVADKALESLQQRVAELDA